MRAAHPLRVGVFTLGAIALIIAAIVVVSGGRLFANRERAVLYFGGSIYGLQLGAPVVFRGVRLGSVMSIGVIRDEKAHVYRIPVEIEVNRALIRNPAGRPDAPSIEELVDEGLTAKLSTQSLLTGLLYVDLDMRPASESRIAPEKPLERPLAALPVIPTEATTIENLTRQLQKIDFGKLVDDVTGLASSARALVADPALKQSLADISGAAADLRQLLARLDRRVDPLAGSIQAAVEDSRRTLAQWDRAAGRVALAVDRAGSAAERADALIVQAGPAMQSIRQAADELARSAAGLRQATGDDAPLLSNVQRAANDVSRAANAVRDLADLLERQPEALIRGRSGER